MKLVTVACASEGLRLRWLLVAAAGSAVGWIDHLEPLDRSTNW